MKRASTFVLFSAALAVAAACGSSNDSTPAGSAGADASGVCTAGDTRTCVGPGARAGGQTCGDDGKWGPCDPGTGGTGGAGGSGGGAGNGSGGAAGTAGAAGTGGSAGAGGHAGQGTGGVAGTGGFAGTASSAGGGGVADAAAGASGSGASAGADSGAGAAGVGGATTDAGADAPAESGPGPNDDPCPTGTIDLNCSDQCGGPTSNCATAECTQGAPYNDAALILSSSQLPYTIRLPANPGSHQVCTCSNVAWEYGVQVALGLVGRFRARVDPPWEVVSVSPGLSPCWSGTQCRIVNSSGPAFYFVTTDMNAPARNATIEAVDQYATCP